MKPHLAKCISRKFIAVAAALALCASCFALCACDVHKDESQIPIASADAHGMDKSDIQIQYEKAGFTNLELVPLKDLYLGYLKEDGEVEEVTIDGSLDYAAKDWAKKDALVRIKYHTYKLDLSSKSKLDDGELTKFLENCDIALEDYKDILDVDAMKELLVTLFDKEVIENSVESIKKFLKEFIDDSKDFFKDFDLKDFDFSGDLGIDSLEDLFGSFGGSDAGSLDDLLGDLFKDGPSDSQEHKKPSGEGAKTT